MSDSVKSFEDKCLESADKPHDIVLCDKHLLPVSYIKGIGCAMCHIKALEAQNEKLLADYQETVAKAAAKERPAYDEQQEKIMRLEAQNAAMEDMAKQYARNEDFYRELLDKCASSLGDAVFISDDGSVQDSPLRLKIPELVESQAKQNAAMREALGKIADSITLLASTTRIIARKALQGVGE